MKKSRWGVVVLSVEGKSSPPALCTCMDLSLSCTCLWTLATGDELPWIERNVNKVARRYTFSIARTDHAYVIAIQEDF